MDKEKILRIILGISFLLGCLVLILYYQEDLFLQKGDVKEEFYRIQWESMLDDKNTNFYKIGMGRTPEEYYLRFYEKESYSPLKLLSEERILLPGKKVVVGLQVNGPSVTVKLFDENMKILDKSYTSTKWKKEYLDWPKEEYHKGGWTWENQELSSGDSSKILPLYQGVKIGVKEVTKDYFSTEGYTLFDGDMEDFNSKDVEGNFLFLEPVNIKSSNTESIISEVAYE